MLNRARSWVMVMGGPFADIRRGGGVKMRWFEAAGSDGQRSLGSGCERRAGAARSGSAQKGRAVVEGSVTTTAGLPARPTHSVGAFPCFHAYTLGITGNVLNRISDDETVSRMMGRAGSPYDADGEDATRRDRRLRRLGGHSGAVAAPRARRSGAPGRPRLGQRDL